MGDETIKGKVMERKLVKLFTLKEYFGQIKTFAAVDAALEQKILPHIETTKKKTKRAVLVQWLRLF